MKARKAARTHATSRAGVARGEICRFVRLGIAEVDRLDVVIETLKILHLDGTLSSKKKDLYRAQEARRHL